MEAVEKEVVKKQKKRCYDVISRGADDEVMKITTPERFMSVIVFLLGQFQLGCGRKYACEFEVVVTSTINQQMHLYNFHLKHFKTLKTTPTCFNIFRSSSGSFVVPC